MRMKGRDFVATAEASEDPGIISEGVLTMLQRSPSLLKHYRVELGEDGNPKDTEALGRAGARHRSLRGFAG